MYDQKRFLSLVVIIISLTRAILTDSSSPDHSNRSPLTFSCPSDETMWILFLVVMEEGGNWRITLSRSPRWLHLTKAGRRRRRKSFQKESHSLEALGQVRKLPMARLSVKEKSQGNAKPFSLDWRRWWMDIQIKPARIKQGEAIYGVNRLANAGLVDCRMNCSEGLEAANQKRGVA